MATADSRLGIMLGITICISGSDGEDIEKVEDIVLNHGLSHGFHGDVYSGECNPDYIVIGYEIDALYHGDPWNPATSSYEEFDAEIAKIKYKFLEAKSKEKEIVDKINQCIPIITNLIGEEYIESINNVYIVKYNLVTED